MSVPRNPLKRHLAHPTKPTTINRGVDFMCDLADWSCGNPPSFVKMIWLLLAFFLAACGPLAIQDQEAAQPQGIQLFAGESLGQTFISQYDGLTGISIHLNKETAGTQELTLILLEDVDSPQVLRTSVVIIEPGTTNKQEFLWEPVQNSAQESYYVQFDLRGEGPVSFSTAPGGAYLDGAMTVNNLPADAQLAFQTSYSRVVLMWGLIKEAFFWLLITLATIAAFVLPGWAIAAKFVPKGTRLGWPGDLALFAGLSLSLYPILFLLTGLLSLNLGRFYAWGPPLLALIYLVWRTFSHPHPRLKTRIAPWWAGPQRWPDLALGILILFICISRFYAIRDIPIPMWGTPINTALSRSYFLTTVDCSILGHLMRI